MFIYQCSTNPGIAKQHMKKIIYISIALLLSLTSCEKSRVNRFKGTYTNEEYTCNPSLTLNSCEDNKICFDFKFGCWFVKTLTCELMPSKKLAIAPIESIGVMSQGGYELFGGTVERNKDELTIVIEWIHYCDPNDPWIDCTAEKKTDTFTYIKS